MKHIPNITNFTYHSFKTPKGRYMEVHYGKVIKTYYGKWDRLKVIEENWFNDEDIIAGLNNLINLYKNAKRP